jgi:hypothetical protein
MLCAAPRLSRSEAARSRGSKSAARQKNVRQKNKDPIFLSYIFLSVRSGVAETMIKAAYFKVLRTKVMAPALKMELRYPSQNFLTDLNESRHRE